MAANNTASETVSWQTNQGRGTWDVISSCVLTLVLCVWTALHLNVPKQNATLWDRFKTKTIWVLIGVFAPEVVVYIAWVQYSSAKHLLNEIQKLGADGTDPSTRCCRGKAKKNEGGSENPLESCKAPRRHKWTMSHAYFAGMGGFAFDCSADDGGQEFIPGSPSLRFTSHAILLLAQVGKLPNIAKADISDKSKADGLAKTLVVLQACWMLSQSAGRLAQGLPITLLEINTIGHCFCALIIYLIWWNKPLHVMEPITLIGDWMRSFTSYSYIRSTMISETFEDLSELSENIKKSQRSRRLYTREIDRLQFILWYPQKQGVTPGNVSLNDAYGLVPYRLKKHPWKLNDTASNKKVYFAGHILPSVQSHLQRLAPGGYYTFSEGEAMRDLNFAVDSSAVDDLSTSYHFKTYVYPTGKSQRYHPDRKLAIQLSRADLSRWKYASQFIQSAEGIVDPEVFDNLTRDLVVTTVNDFPEDEQYVSRDSEWKIALSLTVASAAYGGLHLASWHAHFPTTVEKWMWIGSSIFIAFAGCIPVVAYAGIGGPYKLAKYIKAKSPDQVSALEKKLKASLENRWMEWIMKRVSEFPDTRIAKILGDIMLVIFACFLYSVCLLYLFTRSYIVVEAFISLRALPLDYYDTPIWSNFIPHL